MILFTFNNRQWRTKIPGGKEAKWDEPYKGPILLPGERFQTVVQKRGIQVAPSGLPELWK